MNGITLGSGAGLHEQVGVDLFRIFLLTRTLDRQFPAVSSRIGTGLPMPLLFGVSQEVPLKLS